MYIYVYIYIYLHFQTTSMQSSRVLADLTSSRNTLSLRIFAASSPPCSIQVCLVCVCSTQRTLVTMRHGLEL